MLMCTVLMVATDDMNTISLLPPPCLSHADRRANTMRHRARAKRPQRTATLETE